LAVVGLPSSFVARPPRQAVVRQLSGSHLAIVNQNYAALKTERLFIPVCTVMYMKTTLIETIFFPYFATFCYIFFSKISCKFQFIQISRTMYINPKSILLLMAYGVPIFAFHHNCHGS